VSKSALLLSAVLLTALIATSGVRSTETTQTAPAAMRLIPGGEFIMGSEVGPGETDESPPHKVRVSAFYMDRYEVTNGEFSEFLSEMGNQHEGGFAWLDLEDDDCLIEQREGWFVPKPGYANHPVVEVSWYGAAAYAQWAHKRLPTEAEWEYACRAGTTTWYNVGKTISEAQANYTGKDPQGRWSSLAPVGSFEPNAWGLYDMHGNVWEWCNDWYAPDYYHKSPAENPTGPPSGFGRVARGGSWQSLGDAFILRSSNRVDFEPVTRHSDLGFRCARDAAPQPDHFLP
jgi:formylglycine-generating enzyme required for sulfatase activity